MDTQRFVLVNICSKRHHPPQKFGLNCEEKESNAFQQKVTVNFRKIEELIPFAFAGGGGGGGGGS